MSQSSDGARGEHVEDPGGKKVKRTCGRRCVVGGCSNTKATGFNLYQLPGHNTSPASRSDNTARWNSYQRSWINFISNTRTFKANTFKNIFVCSGHFDQSQFDESQVNRYRLGLLSRPPALLPTAVPHLKKAVQPFPPEWFQSTSAMLSPVAVPTSSHSASPLSTPASTSTTTPRSASQTKSKTPITTISKSATTCARVSPYTPKEMSDISSPTAMAMPMAMMTTPKRAPQSKAASKQGLSSTSCSCVCRCRAGYKQSPKKPRKRSESTLSRKKDIESIEQTYLQKKAEERAQDVANRSSSTQCAQKMVTRKVQVDRKKFGKTCGTQVRPRTKTVGLQTEIFVPPPAADAVLVTTSSTQTTMKGKDMECSEEEDDYVSPDEEEQDDDSDWEPPSDSSDSSDDDMEEESQEDQAHGNIIDKQKYLVFEQNLLMLFEECEKCHNHTCKVEKVRPKSFGSQLKVVATCKVCHHVREWYSQPKIGAVHAGNISISASILYGGGSPTKILRVMGFMNIQTISVSAFMKHQQIYLQPSIVRVWKREQRFLINQVQAEGEDLVVGGDGRSDSPGHCAKFGSYTMMDLRRNKVVDLQLVQSNEVKNSNAMEKEGLRRSLELLYDRGIKVDTMVTDRHLQVAKWVRETYPDIDHRYDVWHIAKGINKKIKGAAKQKECGILADWKRSVVNHIYWCASSTEDGDGEMIQEKFSSMLNHIRNIHHGHSVAYPACQHGEDYPQREWMQEGTKAFDKLSKIISSKRLLKDIGKMSHIDQTSSVESFHSLLLYWCPKMLAYSDSGILCRLYLAGLHWNENGGRDQATKKDGSLRYKLSFPRPKEGGHTVSRVLTACTFNYVKALMTDTELLVTNKMKLRAEIEELKARPPLTSTYDRPDKGEAVEAHNANRRFNRKD